MRRKLAVLVFVCVSVVLMMLRGITAQTAREPSRPETASIEKPVELPLNLTDHVPVIEARINGKGPFRFALDTGFGGLVEVNADIAAKLGLPAIGEARTGDPSGRNPQTLRVLNADTVDIGSAHFTGVRVIERPRVGRPVETDGVVGLNLFQNMLVRLDYVAGKLKLSKGQLPAMEGLSYTTKHGIPNIEIDVNGQKVKTDLDSGSPALVSLP